MLRLLAPLAACLLFSCTSAPGVRNWQPVPCALTVARPIVPVYEVEFLPILPRIPGTIVVGSFRILNNATLMYENEEFMQSIKRMAARMGGNTIVYPGEGVKEAVVAYVPLEEVNYHGGDEALIDAGVLSEDW